MVGVGHHLSPLATKKASPSELQSLSNQTPSRYIIDLVDVCICDELARAI
jgi:hypothetical protein